MFYGHFYLLCKFYTNIISNIIDKQIDNAVIPKQ